MKKGVLSVLALSLALTYGQGIITAEAGAKKASVDTDDNYGIEYSSVRPTVFMHGFTGTVNTFKETAEEMERKGVGVYERVYTVSAKGKVTMKEIKNTIGWRHPLVLIVFKDSTESLDKQTDWFSKAVDTIKADYNTPSVNVISHSMGGLSVTNYIMTDEEKGTDINKFMTVDSPILGARTVGLKALDKSLSLASKSTKVNKDMLKGYQDLLKSPALKDLEEKKLVKLSKKYKGKFPKTIRTLSLSVKGSEVVSKKSAHGLSVYASKGSKSNTFKEVKLDGLTLQSALLKPKKNKDYLKSLKTVYSLVKETNHTKVLTDDKAIKEIKNFIAN